MTALINAVLLLTSLVVGLTRYREPTLLYRLTVEDGIVEWLTVGALISLAVMLFLDLRRLSSETPRALTLVGYALAAACLLGAGEEISWGQRLFGFETSLEFQKLNHQKEANLHNLVPAPIFNGLIIFSVAIFFVLIPLYGRNLKGRDREAAWWLPSQEVSLLTLNVILINHYRFSTLVEKVGIIFILVILLAYTLLAAKRGDGKTVLLCLVGWLTFATLYHSRFVLSPFNLQYEIRELAVVLIVTKYCLETMRPWRTEKGPILGKDGA